MAATTAACKRPRDRRRLAAEAAALAKGCSKFRRAKSSGEAVNFMISGAGVRRIHGLRLSNTRKCQHSRDSDSGRGEDGGDLASHNHTVLHSHSFAALWRPALTTLNVRDQCFWYRGNREGLFGCAEQSKVVGSESPKAA